MYCHDNYCMLEECVEWSSCIYIYIYIYILCSHILVSVDLVWFASK